MAANDNEARAFENTFPDLSTPDLYLDEDGKHLNKELINILQSQVLHHLKDIEKALRLRKLNSEQDYSIYTGTTGIALLYWHIYVKFDKKRSQTHLNKAIELIEPALDLLENRKASMLGGDAGPLALGAVLFCEANRFEDARHCIRRLYEMTNNFLTKNVPDEFLFGRSGLLFSFLFVEKHCPQAVIDTQRHNECIGILVNYIIQSGKDYARKVQAETPLLYEWHDKVYLGAAHGLAGIFYVLLLVVDSGREEYLKLVEEYVQPTIDWMCTLMYSSGNCPSSLGSKTDKLVHWCHGAPGWMFMLSLSAKVFKNNKYKTASSRCSECVWHRGILRKGYGLCHGTAGNAYTHLLMYKQTNDNKYLNRAVSFMKWCFDFPSHGCKTPDRPMSLFEGKAGLIWFLVDLLKPNESKFPCFEI